MAGLNAAEVLASLDEAERLFHHYAPQPLSEIDILVGGRAALEQANGELGLALSDDEIDYLLENFTRVARNPTVSGAGFADRR